MLGKVFWAGALARDGRPRPAEVEQALHELARKELVRPARTSSMEGEARVRLLARARARRLLRADPPRRPRRPTPGGRRLDRARRPASGSKTSPTCSPTTTQAALELAEAAGRSASARSSRRRRCAISGWPASGRSASTSTRRNAAHHARSSWLRGGRSRASGRCSSAGRKPSQQRGRLREARGRTRAGARALPPAATSRRDRAGTHPPRERDPPARRPAPARR